MIQPCVHRFHNLSILLFRALPLHIPFLILLSKSIRTLILPIIAWIEADSLILISSNSTVFVAEMISAFLPTLMVPIVTTSPAASLSHIMSKFLVVYTLDAFSHMNIIGSRAFGVTTFKFLLDLDKSRFPGFLGKSSKGRVSWSLELFNFQVTNNSEISFQILGMSTLSWLAIA